MYENWTPEESVKVIGFLLLTMDPLGLEVNSNEEKIKNTNVFGIGALSVGQIKAQVQHKLLKLMCTSDKPVFLDFREAYKIAQDIKK